MKTLQSFCRKKKHKYLALKRVISAFENLKKRIFTKNWGFEDEKKNSEPNLQTQKSDF